MSTPVSPVAGRPRYATTPLPPYSYVPGYAPHPVSDPRGHMFGAPADVVTPLDPDHWQQSASYFFAADLFNHGFYWEAHEAWESLWHAVGRRGPCAVWLKLLIKLAAAGVKAREGNPVGVRRHALRATELLNELGQSLPAGALTYCGVRLANIEAIAADIQGRAAEFNVPRPTLLLPHWLELGGA